MPAAASSIQERFSYEVRTSRICSSDVIHVLYSAGPTGRRLQLGRFQPVKRAPRTR